MDTIRIVFDPDENGVRQVYPTIADVLARPEVRAGAPAVRAGRAALGTEVRWVHVSELAEPAGTLPDGVLVLSVGLPAADPTTDPARYVAAVRAAGGVGLVVEIGQHLATLPDPLVQAARAAGFPLVELRRTVRFADVVAGVLETILVERHARASFTEHAGSAFRTLTLHGADPQRVLAEAATLLDGPVVCEDLAHRVLLTAGEPDLRDWPARSRLAGPAGPEGWRTAPVGLPGARWGRLAVPARPAADAEDRIAAVLGHAADALSLLVRDGAPAGLLRAAHAALLGALADATPVDTDRLAVRARAAGIDTTGEFEVVLLDGGSAGTAPAVVPDAVVATAGGAEIVLVPLPRRAGAGSRADELVRLLPAGAVAAVAGPGPFDRLPELLREARAVAAAYRSTSPDGARPPVPPRGGRLGVRGLVWRLGDDPRLLGFVEEQLGPVLALPGPEREQALAGLDALVDAGGVVAEFARRIGTGRPAAYARLRRLSALVGADLTEPEVRTSVHLALLGLRRAGH
ncbi:PucR family transcriptional regulator ligand-binding domain-containing protein [Pseudonocardia kongjuensis]|uniref:PucR family transcriptional regulator ligand-binding domain-containing protein n=1 Tax=Pseudonocardia kongjuensis TaxID=102227 RepID=A0ABP4IXR6_9PSEU